MLSNKQTDATEATINNRHVSIVMMVVIMSLMGFVSLELIFPSLPAMMDDFQVNVSVIQFTVPIYLFGYGISQIIYGPLSDYYGRKPILIFGISIYLIGSIFCYFATHIALLLFARLIQGLGVGAGALLARVILRDCFEGERMAKITSYVSGAIIAGISLAPVLGGIIQDLIGYKGNFIIMIIYGVIFLLMINKFLPETNQHKISKLNLREILIIYKKVLQTDGFFSYTFLASMALTVIIAYSLFNPFFFQINLGYSPMHYGFIVLIIALGELVGTSINSAMVERVGIDKMIVSGFLLIGVASLILLCMNAGTLSLFTLLLPTLIAAVGTGLIFANAISAAYSNFKENIGSAGSVFGCLQILLTVVASYLVSLCAVTPFFLASIFFIMCLAGLLISYLVNKDRSVVIST